MAFPLYPNVVGVRFEGGQYYPSPRPSGATIALDLLATATTSSGTLTGGLYHVSNSVFCHFTFDAAYKIQTIAVVPVEAVSYTLTIGAVVLTSGALGADPTIGDLVTALQADADYAAGPVTIAVSDGNIQVTWKTLGTQVASAVLTDDVPNAYTTVTVKAGGAGAVSTNGMLAAGERQMVIPDGSYASFIKSAGASDGIIRLTLCE